MYTTLECTVDTAQVQQLLVPPVTPSNCPSILAPTQPNQPTTATTLKEKGQFSKAISPTEENCQHMPGLKMKELNKNFKSDIFPGTIYVLRRYVAGQNVP